MLAEIQARLTAEVPALKLVAGAAELAALRNNPPKSRQPAAYVLPIADTAGPNSVAMAVSQQVTERFGVALALGSHEDPRGGAASEAMETVKRAVRDALLGWPPETGMEGCHYAGARTIDFRGGVVWLLLEFTTTYHIRKI